MYEKTEIIVTRQYHDMHPLEVIPERYTLLKNETPKDALKRVFEQYYNPQTIQERNDENDPFDTKKCICNPDEEYAQITFKDGDTMLIYIVTAA